MPILRGSKSKLAILLVLYGLALAWQAWRVGITFDEPSHLSAGYMYWLGRDVLFPSDTPPLMRIVSGWVPRVLKTPLRKDTEAWQHQSSFEIGGEIVQGLDARKARRLIFLTRLTFLVFPLLTVWLLWHWARQLFNDTVALVVAVCTALEPTLLAHGPLIKSDMAAAFGCLLFAYTSWRYWQQPGLRRLVAMSLALLVAVLAKFTLLAMIPVALALVLWKGPRLSGAPPLLAIVYFGVLASYQFYESRPIHKDEFQQMVEEGFSRREVKIARILGRLPWPVQFVKGIRYIGKADRNQGFPAYLLGRKIEYGAPLYFPVAWAIKFPSALQLLLVLGLAAAAARIAHHKANAADAFVWLPPAFVMALAMRSHIHIGFRHIMPVLPFLVLGTGFGLHRWWDRRVFRTIVAGCLVWLAAASAWIYPQGISYFNEWIGGPKNGWLYLADSNLDWGQNLPELAQYVAQNHIQRIKTFYFGFDVLDHHLPPGTVDNLAAPWDRKWVTGTRFEPGPGIYAISVNILLGYFFEPEYQNYFAYFKARQPEARAGYSIFIYYVR